MAIPAGKSGGDIMTILSGDRSKARKTDIWSDPIGKIDITEDEGRISVNFTFHFMLPVVQLLAAGIEGFSLSIKPSKDESTYQYFTGDIAAMEADIQDFFIKQSSEKGAPKSEFSSYFYSEIGLGKFVSDKILATIRQLKDSHKVHDYGEGKKSEPTASQIAKKILNKISYLELSGKLEPPFDLDTYPTITSYSEFKSYFRDVAGIYSLSAGDIGNVQFPRNLTNKAFEGDTTHSLAGRIPIESVKWPKSFWALWGHLFRWDMSGREALPTIKQFSSQMFACKGKGQIDFPSSTEGSRLLNAFFLRDTLILEIKLLGKNAKELEPITTRFSALTLLKASSQSMIKIEPRVKQNETVDTISVFNPNRYPVSVKIIGCGWDNESSKLIVGGEGRTQPTLLIPPRTESTIDVPGWIDMASRYYELVQWHGTYVSIAGRDAQSSFPMEQMPWLTISARVPGVAGVVDPTLADPTLGVYRAKTNLLAISIANVPPFVDEIRYYYVSTTTTGAGAKRAPGRRRRGMKLIVVDPGIATQSTVPLGKAELDYSVLFPGKYEVFADLYRKGCVIDTLSVIFYREPVVPAAAKGVAYQITLSTSTTGGAPTMVITETGATSSSGLVASLKKAAAGDNPYTEPFDETWATSNYITQYSVSRFNLENSILEEMGSFYPSQGAPMTYSSLTTRNHVYIVKQFLATAGQLISTQSPTHTTSTRGWSIVVDYAKFSSNMALQHQILPQVRYQLADQDGIIGWPSIAMAAASTGVVKTRSVAATFNFTPAISEMGVVYDEIRRTNTISWRVDWTGVADMGATYTPKYFLLTAQYGGVTSLIGRQLVYDEGIESMSVIDATLAGGLGEVKYRLHIVYPDGSIQNNVAHATIAHVNDKRARQILGRGH